jgi:hypothetical protein
MRRRDKQPSRPTRGDALRYRPVMKAIADLVAEAGGGGLAAEMALRDHVRNLLRSEDADPSEIARFLHTASPRAWLTLDESMRAQWYGGYGEAPAAPGGLVGRVWRALRSAGEPPADVASVGIASMDRDGRVRESAVRHLASESDPLAGPFLALRTTDWVAEVASVAVSVLRDRLPNEPALMVASAPLVFALADRRRRSDLDQIVLESAAVNPGVRMALSKADVQTRRRLISHEPILVASTLDELTSIAISDSDIVVASAAGVAAVSKITEDGAPRERLDRLLAGPALVRSAVLGALPTGEHTRDLAERHLFDRSPSVRGAAQQAYARSGGEPSTVYRAALAGLEHVPIAVLELAHVGSPEDHKDVLAALESPDPAARRAAVNAAGWIAGDRLSDLLVPLLWDPSPGVTRAAEKRLRGMAKILDRWTLDDLAAAPGSHSRRAGYRLLRRRTAPERVEADLVGLADQDDANRRDALGDLRSWLHRGAASAPRADLSTRRRLSQLLDAVQDQLLPHDAERIRFHAALRPADLGD